MRRIAYLLLIVGGVLLMAGGLATAAHGPAVGVIAFPVGFMVVIAQSRNLRRSSLP